MATKTKKKGKTQEPIALDAQLTKAEAFFEKNGKIIIAVIVAVALIWVGLWLFRSCNDKKEIEAQNAISLSQKAFANEQYEEALNGDKAASKGFVKIIDEYSGTKTANLAKLYAAICYFKQDKKDEAIKYLKDFDAEDDNTISPSAIAMLGNCMVDKNDKEGGAAKLVEAANAADNESLSPVFLRQAAFVYEDLKNTDKALELYKQIKEKYPQSVLCQGDENGTMIDTYIERLSK